MWYIAVFLGLGRIRQEDLKFQARLSSSKPAWVLQTGTLSENRREGVAER